MYCHDVNEIQRNETTEKEVKSRNLIKGVLEGRTSTGSENFFLLICLDAIKFVSLSFFTPV